MSRIKLDNPGGENPNPVTKFLEWNSAEKAFKSYDRESGEKEVLELPLKFAFIEQFHTVGGWDEGANCRIYANEVKFIGSQDLNVRNQQGKEIASGKYKEIKPEVLAAGGHYRKSIYAVLADGTLANIQLKGSATQVWGEFTDANKAGNALVDNWLEVTDSEDRKKGAVHYTVPVFELGKKVTKTQLPPIDEAAAKVQTYFEVKFSGGSEGAPTPIAPGEDPEDVDPDDLGF